MGLETPKFNVSRIDDAICIHVNREFAKKLVDLILEFEYTELKTYEIAFLRQLEYHSGYKQTV